MTYKYIIDKEKVFNTAKFGDTIIFKNIDELGKDFEKIKTNFDYLVTRGVVLQFLDQPLLNTFGKTDDSIKTISFLLEYFIQKQKEKINKSRGRKSAYKNLSLGQKEILKNFNEMKISLKDTMELTGFSRATVYKLKKLLFPPDKRDFQNEVYAWIDGKISLKQCMENTGFCRSYLYVLKKKLKTREKEKNPMDILLSEDDIFYPVKYLSEETDFSKFLKFGKIIKFSIKPREECIDYSYGYDKYSEMTEVYKIEKLNQKSIWFDGKKFTNKDFKYKNDTFIYYHHLTAKKDLDNEIKNNLIFYLSRIEMKYKKYHLKLFKDIPSLEKPLKDYLYSLTLEERKDLFIRTKSKIFLRKFLKDNEKLLLEKELKEIYKL